MTASNIKKLKELEDENRGLKRMYADLSLHHEALLVLPHQPMNAKKF